MPTSCYRSLQYLMRIAQLVFDSALWGSVMSFSRWGVHCKEWSATVLKRPSGWHAYATWNSKATSERYAWIWCAKECVKHVVSSYPRNHHFLPFFFSFVSHKSFHYEYFKNSALFRVALQPCTMWILLEKIRMEFCFLLPYKNTRNFSVFEFLFSITPFFWSFFFPASFWVHFHLHC